MVILRMIAGFPKVKAQLGEYKSYLANNPGPLAKQGLDSIRDKEFHCLGGSVYSLLPEEKSRPNVLRFIIAFQTISDYLDNLCDRFGLHSQEVFRQLHIAMLDALDLNASDYNDYYALFPEQGDGGYLRKLVADCRGALTGIFDFPRVKDHLLELTKLYIDLQSYKHMKRRRGEEMLAAHYASKGPEATGLFWWEFAAACGSTLGIFTILAAGKKPDQLCQAYMPWVNGLHILLDYYIDQEEDDEHDDMNLVSYYDGPAQQVERLLWFYTKAKAAVSDLEDKRFHQLVLDGLLALYLSDSKAWSPRLAKTSRGILRATGLRARSLEGMARSLRFLGVI